jgi:hypothetical protein
MKSGGPRLKETDLYQPVKRYLEGQGFTVKGEIDDCDVVAVRRAEEPVVVELKLTLNLNVILQAVARQRASPSVYVGVPRHCPVLRSQRRQVTRLLRMLGLGLLTVEPRRTGARVEAVLDPGVYKPRRSTRRTGRLLREFELRVGDPTPGGADRRRGLMTAYRQAALRIARHLDRRGPTRAAYVSNALDEPRARAIMYDNVYGWFERPSTGTYALSPRGRREIRQWSKSRAGA